MARTVAQKSIVITGAAGGIGSALAECLVRHRCSELVLVDRNQVGLEALRNRLDALSQNQKHPVHIRTRVVNLCSIDEMNRFSQWMSDVPVDIVINNAGIVIAGHFDSMSSDLVDRMVDTNLKAAIHLTRMLLPQLRKARGCVVNVSSAAGLSPPGGMSVYAAAKAGMIGLSDALRVELSKDGISIVTICPAFVKTSIIQNSVGMHHVKKHEKEDAKEASRFHRLQKLVHDQGVDPHWLAERIVRAIEHNEKLVITSWWAQWVVWLKRVSPSMAERFQRLGFDVTTKMGLFG